MTVRAILDTKGHHILSVEPEAKLSAAVKILGERKIGAVLVMSNGGVEGILSERDIVRVRTNYRKENVYLYRLNASDIDARRLLLVYLDRINELADRPEFYHLLSNSCTINIVRYANAAGREGRFDIRHLLNGLVDGYLYHSGWVDTTLPFDELRRRSLINAAAQAADGAPDFSQRIRASLPTVSR